MLSYAVIKNISKICKNIKNTIRVKNILTITIIIIIISELCYKIRAYFAACVWVWPLDVSTRFEYFSFFPLSSQYATKLYCGPPRCAREWLDTVQNSSRKNKKEIFFPLVLTAVQLHCAGVRLPIFSIH